MPKTFFRQSRRGPKEQLLAFIRHRRAPPTRVIAQYEAELGAVRHWNRLIALAIVTIGDGSASHRQLVCPGKNDNMSATSAVTSPHITEQLLDSYLGREITVICPHGYHDKAFNHCSHFVCHVTSLSIGYTCKHQSSKATATKTGACIRVHELFENCPTVGLFANVPSEAVFVFVTSPRVVNLVTKKIVNVPKKHVGIALHGKIWHYSNSKDEVVTASEADFRKHYSGQINELYYGTMPAGAVPVAFK